MFEYQSRTLVVLYSKGCGGVEISEYVNGFPARSKQLTGNDAHVKVLSDLVLQLTVHRVLGEAR